MASQLFHVYFKRPKHAVEGLAALQVQCSNSFGKINWSLLPSMFMHAWTGCPLFATGLSNGSQTSDQPEVAGRSVI